jgi:UDP:flavonoid glycosyltransferase YjiC (YdhE family)
MIIPQMVDQPYFADRVRQLDRGTALFDSPTSDNLRGALEHALGV